MTAADESELDEPENSMDVANDGRPSSAVIERCLGGLL